MSSNFFRDSTINSWCQPTDLVSLFPEPHHVVERQPGHQLGTGTSRTSLWAWTSKCLVYSRNEQHFIFSSSFPSFWNVLRGHLKPVWKVPIRPSNKVKAAKVIQYASHEDTWHCSIRKSPTTQGNHIRSHGCALFVCTVRSTYRIRANWMPLEPILCKVQRAPTLVTRCCNML